MSHIRTKIKYNVSGAWGSIEEKTLYCWHNNSCDVVSFYDDNGSFIFSFEDTLDNNLFEKINEIIENMHPEKNSNIEYMDEDDRKKCGI